MSKPPRGPIRRRKFGGKSFRYFATYWLKRNAEIEQKSKSHGFYTRITKERRNKYGVWKYVLWIRLKSKG